MLPLVLRPLLVSSRRQALATTTISQARHALNHPVRLPPRQSRTMATPPPQVNSRLEALQNARLTY
jgi:hypothetical protein